MPSKVKVMSVNKINGSTGKKAKDKEGKRKPRMAKRNTNNRE